MAKKALAMMTSSEMLAGSAKYIAYAPWRKMGIYEIWSIISVLLNLIIYYNLRAVIYNRPFYL